MQRNGFRLRAFQWGMALMATMLLVLAGCESKGAAEGEGNDEAKAEEAKKPEAPPAEAKAEEPEAAGGAAVAALLDPSATGGTPKKKTLERFRADYKTTEDITSDAELIKAIEKLKQSDQGQEVFDKLKPRKDQVLPILRKALWHESPNVRSHTAKMLHLYNDETDATTKALVDVLLHDADDDVRSVVARVLVSHKPKEAVPALIEVVTSDPFVHARANAVRALGEIRDSRGKAAIKKGLNDPESWVRLRALGAVEEMRIREMRDIVERMTRDPNTKVREKAQKTLRRLGG